MGCFGACQGVCQDLVWQRILRFCRRFGRFELAKIFCHKLSIYVISVSISFIVRGKSIKTDTGRAIIETFSSNIFGKILGSRYYKKAVKDEYPSGSSQELFTGR